MRATTKDERETGHDDRYKWVALANTTASMFMATLDGSIVIIALPAIFRGIHLDPLAAGNISYLLWMIMGYRLVQAVLVVTVGRLGDMFSRVRIYNAGFVVFTIASILLSFDPFTGGHGALWLIGWRLLQAVGGSMLMANSAAILTDAFPASQRGFALGTNQIAGLAGMFVGLVAGGLLSAIDWRWVFWVNVPVGVYGTLWAYLRLRDNGERHRARIDWWGNITFAVGLSAVLIAVTYGIQPYGGHTMGWTSPWVLAGLTGGAVLLAAFAVLETKIAEPMFQLSLFRIRAFTAGNLAGLTVAIAHQIASLPPVSSLFASVLGVNPLGHLLSAYGGLSALPAAARQTLTGREFFPSLISGPFQYGLLVVFAFAAVLSVLAALASALRATRPAAARPAGTGPADAASDIRSNSPASRTRPE
jgi:MFS family permease